MITHVRDWKNFTGTSLEMMTRYWIPIPFNIISQALLSHSLKILEGSQNFYCISWRAYPSNGSKTLVSHVTSCNSVITSRIFSYEMIVRYRFRSSLEQMWSKLFYCCKTSITKKNPKSLTVNWSAQRTVALKHPPFGTDEYPQFSEFPKSFFLHRSWGHNYLWPSTSEFPANILPQ